MEDLIEKTIKQIETKNICVAPKWKCYLKNSVPWIFFSISILIGAAAVNTVLFLLFTHDWDVRVYLHRSLFSDIFMSLPYLWLIILGLFLFFAFYNVEHTKTGYKHNVYLIFSGSVLLSIVLGAALFFSSYNFIVHHLISDNVPFYNALIHDKNDVWNNSHSGLIAGRVISINKDDSFTLVDLNHQVWQIQYEEFQRPNIMPIKPGDMVKLIGRDLGNGNFTVIDIRPWGR